MGMTNIKNIVVMMMTMLSFVSSYIRINPSLPSIKYIQGIHYNSGSLYLGTNDGYMACVTKNDDYKLYRKWISPVSRRNIRKISSSLNYLLVECDATNVEETGKTVLCSIEDGTVLDQQSWRDTTILEKMVNNKEWIRCAYDGTIVSKIFNHDDDFKVRCRLPLLSSDYITAATIYEDCMYMITLNGYLWVLDVNSFKIINRYQLNFYLASSIEVVKIYPESSSVFIYIGNQEGSIQFLNIKDGKIISQTNKHVMDGVVTKILSNKKDVFVGFQSSEIFQFDIISFDEITRMKTNHEFYSNVDSISLSSNGLFTISDNEKEILLHPLT